MLEEMVKSLLFPHVVVQRAHVASMFASMILAPHVMKSELTELLFLAQEKADSEHTAVCEIVNTDNRKKCQNETSR